MAKYDLHYNKEITLGICVLIIEALKKKTLPPGRIVLRTFSKIHQPQLGLNPWTLGHEVSTLSRDE